MGGAVFLRHLDPPYYLRPYRPTAESGALALLYRQSLRGSEDGRPCTVYSSAGVGFSRHQQRAGCEGTILLSSCHAFSCSPIEVDDGTKKAMMRGTDGAVQFNRVSLLSGGARFILRAGCRSMPENRGTLILRL